ncbi:MAG: pseudouridine synthase [Firmicutes bacterium]|nr:pseudouridine synthase [Bacillota bacterium]
MERLQKYMARCGAASRRKSEELISAGRVTVNGQTVSDMGYKVNEGDEVKLDGKPLLPESRKVYIALNKPVGYVSTVKDERGRKTLLDLVDVPERIYPIGRLDYDTSGLILLTNDGEIYNKVIHPREEKNKVYIAMIQGILTGKEIEAFENGLEIEGYVTAPAEIKTRRILGRNAEVEITIHEGRNRQIRKMCEKIGHPVITLKRISIGSIEIGGLEAGKWRFLTEKEVGQLK